jgi:hypothetical protein
MAAPVTDIVKSSTANGFRGFLRAYGQWLLILALAIFSFALGAAGFVKLRLAAGETVSPLDICYLTLQLFTLESGAVTHPVPWELGIARYTAPLVPAWAVVKTLALIFHDQTVAFRLRFLSEHVVICGAGRKGLQLTREFRRRGVQAVVIDQEPENIRLRRCADLGAITLTGDASEKGVLRLARVHRAKQIIAICNNDGKNVEIALRSAEIVHEDSAPPRQKVHCAVHIVDLQLSKLFKQHPVFTDTSDRIEVSVVNIYVNIARAVFEDHPLDRDHVAPGDRRRVHLIILGFGRTGENMALQAARIGHYANGAWLRITVVDQAADIRRKAFLTRYPAFEEVCETEFIQGRVHDPEVLARIGAETRDPAFLTTILVALGNDSDDMVGGLTMLSQPDIPEDIPILVRVSERAALASLLSAGHGRHTSLGRVHTVGLIQRVCTEKMFLNKELDLLARAIHEDFVRRRMREGADHRDPSCRPWELLDQARKDSNRQQADHIAVKLRAIHCRAVPGKDESTFTFSEEECELLARMEHARWKAHRYLTGWSPGPAKDTEKKTSPWLGEWETLPESVKEQNREPVRNIPRLLALTGKHIAHCGEEQATA